MNRPVHGHDRHAADADGIEAGQQRAAAGAATAARRGYGWQKCSNRPGRRLPGRRFPPTRRLAPPVGCPPWPSAHSSSERDHSPPSRRSAAAGRRCNKRAAAPGWRPCSVCILLVSAVSPRLPGTAQRPAVPPHLPRLGRSIPPETREAAVRRCLPVLNRFSVSRQRPQRLRLMDRLTVPQGH